MPNQHEIFFSYAWGDADEPGESREKIVNELYESLKKDGFNVVRDTYDLDYRGSISDFMARIGQGKNIIVVISQKYVRSPYCMFELYEIARYSNFDKKKFREKVLPIMLDFIDFGDPKVIDAYGDIWDAKLKEWDNLVFKRARQLSADQFTRYTRVKKIFENFGELTDWLIDMNSFTPAKLSNDDFVAIKNSIFDSVGHSEIINEGAPANSSEKANIPFDGSANKIGEYKINNPIYYNYGGKKIKKFLCTPFFPEIFLGREDDLKAMHQKLFNDENLLLLVNGEGGIGKTTLASKYYFKYQNDYQHLAWIFAENSLLEAILTLSFPLEVSFPETMNSEVRLDSLLVEICNLNKPCLLVIDNANKLEDLEKYYYKLRSCPNFHVLLTTRITEFEDAKSYKIEELPVDKAIDLFIKHYPKHLRTDDKLLKEIRTAVGGNTLVLELLAKNLRNFNRLRNQYSLTNLLADLQKEGLLALSKSQEVSSNYHTKGKLIKEKPEDIIAAMYNLGDLDEKEKKLLSFFAVLPAESISFDTLQSILPSWKTLEDTLLALAKKGWLDYNELNTSFKVTPIIQEITKRKNLNLLEDCHQLVGALKDKLNFDPGTGQFTNASYVEVILYARYTEALISSFEQTDYKFAQLLENLVSYHTTSGNLDKALTYCELYAQLSKKLYEAAPTNISFKNGMSISCEKLGEIQALLGNFDEALSYYEQGISLEKELYEADPKNLNYKSALAISYSKLGATHASLGNLEKALCYYEIDAQLSKELYEVSKELFESQPQNVSFKNSLAISYEKLGLIQATLGNLDKALIYFEDETKLFEELYVAEPKNISFKNRLAISYEKMGSTQASLGQLDKALAYFQQRSSLGKELYDSDTENFSFKRGLAISYEKLGSTFTSLGNLDKALDYFKDETKLFEELYKAYPNNVLFKNGLAISYEKLGSTLTSLGNLNNALGYFQDETKLFEQLFSAYHQNINFKNGLAISYEKLGSTHALLGDYFKALGFHEQFEKLSKELYEAYPQNVNFKYELAISYSRLGETQTSLGNHDKALVHFEQRLTLGKELYEAYPSNVSFKNGLAISYEKLGLTEAYLGNFGKALAYYKDEIKLFKELCEAYPQNISFLNGLAISNIKLGAVYEDQQDETTANNFYKIAKDILSKLVVSFPAYVEFKKNLDWANGKLMFIK